MFGYIKVYKPELKMGDYDHYRAVYCSLCQALGKRYGFAARITLSYDFAFLALFLMALSEEETTFTAGHCPFRPLKKRLMCRSVESEALAYAADTAVLLVYHKLSDTVRDERRFKRFAAWAARLLMHRDYQKAASRRPDEATAAAQYMAAQAAIEDEKTASVDAAADPTATLLSQFAAAFLPKEHDAYDAACRFGYQLGRFVYLADAADDLQDDAKEGQYNPFLQEVDAMTPQALDERRLYAEQVLHGGVAVCTECYEDLPIRRFDAILRNVLYEGMPSVIHHICHPEERGECHEQSV